MEKLLDRLFAKTRRERGIAGSRGRLAETGVIESREIDRTQGKIEKDRTGEAYTWIVRGEQEFTCSRKTM